MSVYVYTGVWRYLIECGQQLGIISFIFSILGLSKEPKGLAIAGLIISIVAIPFVVLYQILFGSILKSLLYIKPLWMIKLQEM